MNRLIWLCVTVFATATVACVWAYFADLNSQSGLVFTIKGFYIGSYSLFSVLVIDILAKDALNQGANGRSELPASDNRQGGDSERNGS